MKKLSAVVVALFICPVLIMQSAALDYTSEQFWQNCGEWHNLHISGETDITKATYKCRALDNTQQGGCGVALRFKICDSANIASALNNISVCIMFRDSNNALIDTFTTNACDAGAELEGDNGNFAYSWKCAPASSGGIYCLCAIYDNLSKNIKSKPFSVGFFACDSQRRPTKVSDYDSVSVGILSPSESTTTSGAKSRAKTSASEKHARVSTTARRTSTSGSSSGSKNKIRVSTTASGANGADNYDSYEKAGVVTQQSNANSSFSWKKAAAVAAGTVSAGCALALIISASITKHKKVFKVSAENETEKK